MNADVIAPKCGGTSGATGPRIRDFVENIIKKDKRRKYLTVSAPGKCQAFDQKITDNLYELRQSPDLSHASQIFGVITKRFMQIKEESGSSFDPRPHLEELDPRGSTLGKLSLPYVMSRGEVINAHFFADVAGYLYVDATEVIKLDEEGRWDQARSQVAWDRLDHDAPGFVFPGYFAEMPDKSVATFSRGGSDYSGAIIAAQAGAILYENWTDVSGLLMADPHIVTKPRRIELATYSEVRELSYMGAKVLHDEVIFPLEGRGIPINIRNTFDPDAPGTMIVPDDQVPRRERDPIVGIAGSGNFVSLTLRKRMMNKEKGFIRKVSGVFEHHDISIEHTPGTIDTYTVVINRDQLLPDKLDAVKNHLWQECMPDKIEIDNDVALVCTVGHAHSRMQEIEMTLLGALARKGIESKRRIVSERSIMVYVKNADFQNTVRSIYQAVVA